MLVLDRHRKIAKPQDHHGLSLVLLQGTVKSRKRHAGFRGQHRLVRLKTEIIHANDRIDARNGNDAYISGSAGISSDRRRPPSKNDHFDPTVSTIRDSGCLPLTHPYDP